MFMTVIDILNVLGNNNLFSETDRKSTVHICYGIITCHIIRTILYYPMSTGRNMDEIKRIIQALQVHDKEGVSTPADWRPGDKVVVGAPLTLAEADERLSGADGSVEVLDWYLGLKQLDK